MLRVAINGYGRIGRIAHRIIAESYRDQMEVVAINTGSSTDLQGWAYLLKYDTVYGIFPHEISVKAIESTDSGQAGMTSKDDKLGTITIDGKGFQVFSQKDPSLLPWRDLGVDVVIESTGHFRTKDKLELHLKAGARAVVLSAPAKGEGVGTYVLSVNEKSFDGSTIISNASCTTNCIAPVAKIVHDNFGIEKAMMTTVHGYTSDQELQDGGHKDYRRARAAALNIIPTSTGATIAASKALPALKGIFSGLSVRVPVPVGSLADFTFLLKKDATVDEVNKMLTDAAGSDAYRGIVEVTRDPIVSSDVIGNSHSSIIDLSLTQVVGGNMLKVIAWYDNEFGYANRLVEELLLYKTI